MIGTSMSNQTILIVLVIVILIILGLIWFVLSHKYEAGMKTGGRQEIEDTKPIQFTLSDNNNYKFSIDQAVNSVSSKSSHASNNSTNTYYGEGGYRLSFDPDTYKLLLQEKKHYELRAFSKYYDENSTSEKSGRTGRMPVEGDEVVLARSRPDGDTTDYEKPYRFNAKFGKVQKFKNLAEALEAYEKVDKSGLKAMKESFEKYNKDKPDLLKGPVLLFELKFKTNDINDAIKHQSSPRPHNERNNSSGVKSSLATFLTNTSDKFDEDRFGI